MKYPSGEIEGVCHRRPNGCGINKNTRKRKRDNFPPHFWDSLQHIFVTRRALREFDRRVESTQPQLDTEKLILKEGPLRRSETLSLTDVAQTGGFDLSILRGYAARTRAGEKSHSLTDRYRAESKSSSLSSKAEEEIMSSSRERGRRHGRPSRSRGSRTTSRSTSPYSRDFERGLMESGVYTPHYIGENDAMLPDPRNLEELRDVLNRRRASRSPSAADFLDFRVRSNHARSAPPGQGERLMMENLVPHLGGLSNADHHFERGRQFNLVPFREGLSQAKPDLYYGTPAGILDRQVRDDLKGYITPSRGDGLPAAPNFFLEGKGPHGTDDVAIRQATHNGAIGARGMFHLQNYGDYDNGTPTRDGNAYTISGTYVGNTLQFYATHPRSIEEIRGGAMLGSAEYPELSPSGNSGLDRAHLPSSSTLGSSTLPLGPSFRGSTMPPEPYPGRPSLGSATLPLGPGPSDPRQRPLLPAGPSLPQSNYTGPPFFPPTGSIEVPAETPDGNVYITTELQAFPMTSDHRSYQTGVRAFRNARDWARDRRDEFTQEAARRAARRTSGSRR